MSFVECVEYAGSVDSEGWLSDEDETAARIDRAEAAAKKKRISRFRRYTEPQPKVPRKWFSRRSSAWVPGGASPHADDGEGDGVTHFEGVNLAAWHGRMEERMEEEKRRSDQPFGRMRRASKKLSSGAVSVGKKCASKVRKYCRADSGVSLPQYDDTEALLATSPTAIQTSYSYSRPPSESSGPEPRGRTLRRPTSMFGVSPTAHANPQHRLASMTTATDTHRTASPVASFRSNGDPADINTFGPNPDPEAMDLWYSSFQHAFSLQEGQGRLSSGWREWLYLQFPGNQTCEEEQLEASDLHQFQARWEAAERHCAKLEVQHDARKGFKAVLRESIACGVARGVERRRLRRMRSKREVGKVAAVVGDAVRKCGDIIV